MTKYQNQIFKSNKEAIAYKESFKTAYGFESQEPIIKVTQSTERVPEGTIITALDETKGYYVLNPFYGMGSLVYLPKQSCERIC